MQISHRKNIKSGSPLLSLRRNGECRESRYFQSFTQVFPQEYVRLPLEMKSPAVSPQAEQYPLNS